MRAGGPYFDPAFPETIPPPQARRSGRATVLATAWGTLAFLARGYTPRSEGPFAEVARRAIAALRSRQAADGTLRDGGRLASNEAQALGALALLEAYGLTGSAALRGPANTAVAALAMRLPDLLAEARRTEDGAFTLATVFRLASTLTAMRADRTPGFEASALPPSDPYERAADAYLAEASDRDVRGTAGDLIARVLARIFRRRDLRRTPALREAVELLVAEVMGAPADRALDARTVPYTYLLVTESSSVTPPRRTPASPTPSCSRRSSVGRRRPARHLEPLGALRGLRHTRDGHRPRLMDLLLGSRDPAGASAPTGGRGRGRGAGGGFSLTLRASRLRGLPAPRTLWASGGPHPLAHPRPTSTAMTLPPPPPPPPTGTAAPSPRCSPASWSPSRSRESLATGTHAADPEPKPMPAPVKSAPAVVATPRKPAIDLAIPKVVRTATFALG